MAHGGCAQKNRRGHPCRRLTRPGQSDCRQHRRNANSATAAPGTPTLDCPTGEYASFDPSTCRNSLQLVADVERFVTNQASHEAARWWDSLDPAQQAWLEANCEDLGNVNGVPLEVRDRTNRRALELEVARRSAALGKTPRWRWRARRRRREELKLLQRLEATAAFTIEDRWDNRSGRQLRQDLMLHTFLPSEGKLAAAYGPHYEAAGDGGPSPIRYDTISEVTVLAPGTGTRLGTFGKQLDRAGHIDNSMRRIEGVSSQQAVTLAWLNYDAPSNLMQAMRRKAGEVGGRRLHSDASSFTARHMRLAPSEPRTVSFIGHSYGTRVTAAAVAAMPPPPGRGTRVRLVIAGTPGIGSEQDIKDVRRRLYDQSIVSLYYGRDFLYRGGSSLVNRATAFIVKRQHGIDIQSALAQNDQFIHIPAVSETRPRTLLSHIVKAAKDHSGYFDDGYARHVVAWSAAGALPKPTRAAWLADRCTDPGRNRYHRARAIRRTQHVPEGQPPAGS